MISERTKMKCRIYQKPSCGCAGLRQDAVTVRADMPPDYETAFTICQKNDQLARGDAAAGGPYAVSLNINCPGGYHPVGIWHSHPNGNSNPSDADIAEMRKLGLEHMCISVPQTGELRCHRVSRR